MHVLRHSWKLIMCTKLGSANVVHMCGQYVNADRLYQHQGTLLLKWWQRMKQQCITMDGPFKAEPARISGYIICFLVSASRA